MRLSSSSCMRAKTASRASRLPASRSSPMPYSTPRTDRVFGSAAADQHLAPVGAGEQGARIYRAHRMLQFAPRWRGPAAETGRPGPTFSCARGALRSAAHPARRPSRAVRPPRSGRLARRPRQSQPRPASPLFLAHQARRRAALALHRRHHLGQESVDAGLQGAEMAGPGRDMRVVPRLRLAVGRRPTFLSLAAMLYRPFRRRIRVRAQTVFRQGFLPLPVACSFDNSWSRTMGDDLVQTIQVKPGDSILWKRPA